jgi:CRP-like cAMP-binding protein
VLRRFDEGDIICEEGEFGSTAFFVVEGTVDIYIANPLAKVQSQRSGGIFGMLRYAIGLGRKPSERDEYGYITIDADVDLPKNDAAGDAWGGGVVWRNDLPARFSRDLRRCVRRKDCVMIEMLRVILDMLVGTREVDADTKASTKVKAPTFKGTTFKKEMDEKYRRRSLVNHLRSVPLFGELGDEFLGYLRDRAELISCAKGQVICKQGDPADAFYLIRSGWCAFRNRCPAATWSARISSAENSSVKSGSFFHTPRNATCTALDAVDLVKIGAAEFMEMISKFPGSKSRSAKSRSLVCRRIRIDDLLLDCSSMIS